MPSQLFTNDSKSQSGKISGTRVLPHCLVALKAIFRQRAVRVIIFFASNLRHREGRSKWDNALHAQLRRFLHDKVHLFAFGQRDAKRNLAAAIPARPHRIRSISISACSVDSWRIIASCSQPESSKTVMRSPGPRAEHLLQMHEFLRRLSGREFREVFFSARKNEP